MTKEDKKLIDRVAKSFKGKSRPAIYRQIEEGDYNPDTSSNDLIPHDYEMMCRKKDPTQIQRDSGLSRVDDVVILIPALYILNTFGDLGKGDKIVFPDKTYQVEYIWFVEKEETPALYKMGCIVS